ncbi:MAG: acyl transferase [Saprospiraceae bacterium]
MPIRSTDHLKRALQTLTSAQFEELALDIFRLQIEKNVLYRRFVGLLGVRPESVTKVEQVPFLPISFFKTHQVRTGQWREEAVFESSGTGGGRPSRHFVRDLQAYLDNALRGFEAAFGPVDGWRILALLPNYIERGASSLVAMVDYLIRRSGHPDSGFFLYDHAALARALARPAPKTLLLGVSYALLDFAEYWSGGPLPPGVAVMETGGMKGRRREMTRQELHDALKSAFGLPQIYSEYGMTELFSQAYLCGPDMLFAPAPTLRAYAVEIQDPLTPAGAGRNGALCFVDLANWHSCAFVATEDVGRVYADGRFSVMGRLDHAEIRGCNLLLE